MGHLMKLKITIAFVLMLACLVTRTALSQDNRQGIELQGTCVSSADGQPIADATICLCKRDFGRAEVLVQTKSGVDGRFRMKHPDTKANQIFLITSAPKYGTQVLTVSKEPADLQIKLTTAATLVGTVTDSANKPVPNAIVHVGQPFFLRVGHAVTDAQGKFSLADASIKLDQSKRGDLITNRLFVSHPQLGMKSIVLEKIAGDPQEVNLQFDSELPEDYLMQFRVAQYGTHQLPGGVTLTVKSWPYHGPNMMTKAILQWPARDGLPALETTIDVASDSFGNRERWTMIWPKDRSQLWIASSMNDNPIIRAFDFSDPTDIVHFFRAQKPVKPASYPGKEIEDSRILGMLDDDTSRDVPQEILRSIRHSFPKLSLKVRNQQIYCHAGTGQAITQQHWIVKGRVTDKDGQPLSRISVRAVDVNTGRDKTSTGTNDAGEYELKFQLGLNEAATHPDIHVVPFLANHYEAKHADDGRFRVAINRLDPGDTLILGEPGHADFRLLKAATLEGKLTEPDRQLAAGGRLELAWESPSKRTISKSVPIGPHGRIHITDLPTGDQNILSATLFNAQEKEISTGKLVLSTGRMQLSIDDSRDLIAKPFVAGPVSVSIVQSQKPMPPPDDEAAFEKLVHQWIESVQGNNTQAIKEHDPAVWQKVVAGYNRVHLKYREPKKMMVHTDDGVIPKEITEVAFEMYDMRPGAIFALSGDETLVLQDPLIGPTIGLISDPAVECFVSKWYQPYIDAWNHPPPDLGDSVAKISIDPKGVLQLDDKPLPKDVNQLTSIMKTEGYDRRESMVLITAQPATPYGKLHWVMWKLGQSGWKGRIILRIKK